MLRRIRKKLRRRPRINNKYYLLAIIILAAVAGAVFLLIRASSSAYGCVTSEEERTVRGSSLTGVLADGSEVKLLHGFYACNHIRRGDLVVYKDAGIGDPLIKIAMALPGDSFSLQPSAGGVWTIYVNGKPLVSPRGGNYTVDSTNYPRFHLYEVDYGKSLPENVYMILGTDPRGSFDSRIFGLVNKLDIIGKAEIVRNGPR